MLDAALVIFACLNSTGCQETSARYLHAHPELKQFAKRKERQLKEVTGPFVFETIGPVFFVAAGGTGTIKLHREWNLQVSNKSGMLFFRKEF